MKKLNIYLLTLALALLTVACAPEKDSPLNSSTDPVGFELIDLEGDLDELEAQNELYASEYLLLNDIWSLVVNQLAEQVLSDPLVENSVILEIMSPMEETYTQRELTEQLLKANHFALTERITANEEKVQYQLESLEKEAGALGRKIAGQSRGSVNLSAVQGLKARMTEIEGALAILEGYSLEHQRVYEAAKTRAQTVIELSIDEVSLLLDVARVRKEALEGLAQATERQIETLSSVNQQVNSLTQQLKTLRSELKQLISTPSSGQAA